MSEYRAPIKDMSFVLNEMAGLGRIAALPGCEDATPDLVEAILDEASKLAGEVLSPLNISGDREGARWKDGEVKAASGFAEAYQQFIEGGWNGLAIDAEHGGQGLPKLVATPVHEMWKSANMAFSLCPMLTSGAIEALTLCGSDEVKAVFLEKMVEGKWTGTMNLTEPQAGSDLAAVRTLARPQADGTYRVHGQKIFITWGEHDMAENIVHLVLARLPDAPAGVKGISLFVVPKFFVNADGSLGERNDVRCVSIEHKLGIHASPTCVLAFGDQEGAVGYLVGEANRGLEYMFVMMNAARFAVGLEGVAISERAYQRAVAYARDRVQSAEVGVRGGSSVPIIRHPDVRRMLMQMRAQTEAMRALAYGVAAAMDVAKRAEDATERGQYQAFVELMIPVVKGWSTEVANEVTSLGVQVHGGMGFIEETGAAQHMRDARITAIYEGTTGIQANDLIGRKIAREGGQTLGAVVAIIREVADRLGKAEGKHAETLKAMQQPLADAVEAVSRCGIWLLENFSQSPKAAHAAAVPFLMLFGTAAGGWQMARAALVAAERLDKGEGDTAFYQAKLSTALFYADHLLGRCQAYAYSVCTGSGSTLALDEDAF